MNHNTLLAITILGIVLLLTACEGDTNREWKIENNASSTIQVKAITIFDLDTTVENINSGSTKVMGITNQLGGNSNPESPTAVFSSLLILNEIGDTIKKDHTSPENWETYIEQTKKAPSIYKHEYTLQVTDEDF